MLLALLPSGTFAASGTLAASRFTHHVSRVGNPYLFQGARYDAETGFYYLRNRYYNPRTGRFLQRDPVWDDQNVGGWYTFVGNRPTSRLDPFGLDDAQGEHAKELEALKEAAKTNPSAADAIPALERKMGVQGQRVFIDFDQPRWATALWEQNPFKGGWMYCWTEAQQELVRQYLDTVEARLKYHVLPALQSELEAQRQKLSDEAAARSVHPRRGEWVRRVQELHDRVASLLSYLADPSAELELELRNLGTEESGRHVDPLVGGNLIQLNVVPDHKKANFFQCPSGEALATFFHELMHEVGIEDVGKAKYKLEEAQELEKAFGHTFDPANPRPFGQWLSRRGEYFVERGLEK